MKVLNYKDNPDGSASLEVEMTEEERDILINHAINDILRKHLETKPKVLLTLEGGVVQDVCSDIEIDVVQLDFDEEDFDVFKKYAGRVDSPLIEKCEKKYGRSLDEKIKDPNN